MGLKGDAVTDGTYIHLLVAFDGATYIWRSSTGTDWTLHRLACDQVSNPCSPETIRATSVGTLAFGHEWDLETNRPRRAFVFSYDLESKVRDLSAQVDMVSLVAAASTRTHTALIGYQQAPSSTPAVRTTVNGGTWKRTLLALPDDAVYADVHEMVALGGSLLVLGTVSPGVGTERPAVWSSRDGTRWRVTPLPSFAKDGRLVATANLGRRVVLIAASGFGPQQVQNGIFVSS
jgi:hypothetical protein